ncbi:MAG: hypothetical protein WEE89_10165 [Gemmatimonadota bacterium]
MAEARRHSTIREGILAGIIGAASVAIWFFILDAPQGRLLFTPAALGSGFLLGARGVDQVEITTTTPVRRRAPGAAHPVCGRCRAWKRCTRRFKSL